MRQKPFGQLLTKHWLAAHVFVILCVVVFPILGWWQWERSQTAAGGMQNFGYALQWPAFAIILVYVWVKSMRDEVRPKTDDDPRRTLTKEETRPAQGISLATKKTLSSSSEPVGAEVENEDAEVAAYNRYLARLSARHQQATRHEPQAARHEQAAR